MKSSVLLHFCRSGPTVFGKSAISLLNTDIKIASAALANRLRPVFPFIISDTQKGFMKDRFMGENTRLLYDLMHYLEENNKTGLLLLVDFEKAFDSIEWLFLKKH